MVLVEQESQHFCGSFCPAVTPHECNLLYSVVKFTNSSCLYMGVLVFLRKGPGGLVEERHRQTDREEYQFSHHSITMKLSRPYSQQRRAPKIHTHPSVCLQQIQLSKSSSCGVDPLGESLKTVFHRFALLPIGDTLAALGQ